MKRILTAVLMVLVVLFVAACAGSGGNNQGGQKLESKEQSAASVQIITNQPLPAFPRSQARQNLIEIETARAKGVQTTSFFFNLGVSKPVKSCPSVGAPIPTTDQLSNPQKIVHDGYPDGGAAVDIPQMDPDGVYTGQSDGTYVLCISPTGEVHATYWEGHVLTEFAPAHYDNTTGQIVDDGPSTFKFTGGEATKP